MLIVPLGLVRRRKQRAQAARDALARGIITAELTAALGDQVVIAYRMGELIILTVIIALMVMKPF